MADRILTNNADIIRDTLSKTKDIRVEKVLNQVQGLMPLKKSDKILEKNNTAEKSPHF